MTTHRVKEARALREQVFEKIVKWEKNGKIDKSGKDEIYKSLRDILQYKGTNVLVIYSESEANFLLPKFKTLLGPHGLTIYKALKIKANVSVHDT